MKARKDVNRFRCTASSVSVRQVNFDLLKTSVQILIELGLQVHHYSSADGGNFAALHATPAPATESQTRAAAAAHSSCPHHLRINSLPLRRTLDESSPASCSDESVSTHTHTHTHTHSGCENRYVAAVRRAGSWGC